MATIWMCVKNQTDGSCVLMSHPPAFHPTQPPPGWIVKWSSDNRAKVEQFMKDLCGDDRRC